MSLIEFWDGKTLDIDLRELASTSVPVKGAIYKNPCRLLEIYSDPSPFLSIASKALLHPQLSYDEIKAIFLPRIPKVDLELGPDFYQPPFLWSDCSASVLALNFTYSTNAIYRILSTLAEEGSVPVERVPSLVDQACLMLATVYRSNNNSLIKCINNNLNMFLISKTIECILGKHVYDTEKQEVIRTTKALSLALEMIDVHAMLEAKQQMALALGKGIAFLEKHATGSTLTYNASVSIQETAYQYTEGQLAIDDREKLLTMIDTSKENDCDLIMCAILDDTAESVDDLLWMQSLMIHNSRFKVNLLLNTAQVSINFADFMMERLLQSPSFKPLRSCLGDQLTITRTYCPLISFQTNLFTPEARKTIHQSDFVFVKGLNFFETCQFIEKDVFHAFVVYGPISRLYTGLEDFDGVFAFVPAGVQGYSHSADPAGIMTLHTLWTSLKMVN